MRRSLAVRALPERTIFRPRGLQKRGNRLRLKSFSPAMSGSPFPNQPIQSKLMKTMIKTRNLITMLVLGAAFAALPFTVNAEESAPAKNGEQITVTGEVLDMACYTDHGAHGAKHAKCARMCIESGLPVGIKGDNGVTYLLIGEHKPANDVLAQYAAKTITVQGKFVSRDGINMIENIEILNKG